MRGLKAAGVHIRFGGFESPETIGRGERHGGIIKTDMEKCVKVHEVIGKQKMKMAGAICQESKNTMMRKGGVSPYQWVLGINPRIPGLLTEDDEWGQLGVLEQNIDPSTAMGLRAQLRRTSRKNFVKIDCSRRYAASLLRKSVPLRGPYEPGCMVMYKRLQGSGEHSGDTWDGPARLLGSSSSSSSK